MAIYHLHARIIGRSAGKSAVSSAAWQSASRLRDHRLDQFADFVGQRKVVHNAIAGPPGAPDVLMDRERLWNCVEAFEKRWDAQLARQIDVAIPDELDFENGVMALRQFADRAFLAEGFFADIALIETEPSPGLVRRHGYFLVPTRPVVSGCFDKKRRDWNTWNKLVELRAAWADVLNERLAACGSDSVVDHRSNSDRGIETVPRGHVGLVATKIARRRAGSAS